jgi:hypothetical protein
MAPQLFTSTETKSDSDSATEHLDDHMMILYFSV